MTHDCEQNKPLVQKIMPSAESPQQPVVLTAEQAFHQAMVHHQAGKLQEAENLYRAILQALPDHPDTNHNLGVLACQVGQFAAGLPYLRNALAVNPVHGQYVLSYAEALLVTGQADDALYILRSATQRGLDTPVVHALLEKAEAAAHGERVLAHTGRREDAPRLQSTGVESDPVQQPLGQADLNQLATLFNAGRFTEMENRAQFLIDRYPDAGIAWNMLGIALHAQGKEASLAFQKATELMPGDAEAHNNLGVALQGLGRFDGAAASFRRALGLKPRYAAAHYNLGNALRDLGQFDSAMASYRQALEISPNYAKALCNLGNVLQGLGQASDAAASCRRALAIEPDIAEAHNNLGNALKDLGQLDSALSSYRRALEIKPDFTDAYSNLLLTRCYLSNQAADVSLVEARCFGDLVDRKAQPYRNWSNVPEPDRCLRVGLVSGDLHNHPVGHFLEGVLAALVPRAAGRLELIAYSNNARADALTGRIKASCHGWHAVAGLSDEQLARKIRDDRIDILIDLSGHTARNRLPVFAWKAAPVQASWLGYLATTGVAAMDYFIADAWTLPATEETQFTETIWRLPQTYLCFTAPRVDIAVSRLPALTNGYVTFGCFNNLTKMNDEVVALWSRVLTAVPGSRLFLKAAPLKEASVRQSVIERFGVHGIDAERLILKAIVPRAEYLAPYQEIDIALDPFPYPGITTSVEGLWMGVPFLTMAGENFLSRQGVGLLTNAGLSDWIAADANDYVARAAAHAGDLERLATLRGKLRQQVLASPIFDTGSFAEHFEAALRGMWSRWCNQQ